MPDQPEIVFALTNIYNVYKGIRGGKTWQRLPLKGIASILVDPIKTTRIYAGTRSGAGVYISENGGDTWPMFVPFALPDAYAGCGPDVLLFLAIPVQPGTVLAGVRHEGGFCDPTKGSIYRSTDYGEQWDRVYPIQPQESSEFRDLAFDVVTPTIVYTARAGGMLKSSDAGQTWEIHGRRHRGIGKRLEHCHGTKPPIWCVVSTGNSIRRWSLPIRGSRFLLAASRLTSSRGGCSGKSSLHLMIHLCFMHPASRELFAQRMVPTRGSDPVCWVISP